MIYATCINEQQNFDNTDYVLNIIQENNNTIIQYYLDEIDLLNEAFIDDKYRNPKKKTKFEILKELVNKLWTSFREWCKTIKQKITDLINKVKTKIMAKRNNPNKQQSDSSSKTKATVKTLVLNDKFNKIDESKLMKNEILDLSKYLQNYDKNLFENYDNSAYTQSLVQDVTGGEFSSIDDIKGKELVEEKDITEEEKNNINDINELAKKYDNMISEVDHYFNKLQDSIKKAESKFKGQMLPTAYSDDNISAISSTPLQTKTMQQIINTVAKMIGAQSGVVRNIVYAKVDAISKVIESRAN